MQHMMTNWKTTSSGMILIVLGLFENVTGIHIPGFSMDSGPAIAAGIGLLLAKDGGS